MDKPKIDPSQIAARLLDPEAQKKEEERVEAARKKSQQEEIKKSAQKIKPKQYYDVKVECLLPGVVVYRVLAEDAQQAAELIKGQSPISATHKLIGRKELVAKVYDSGSSMLRHMKKLLGR